MVRITEDLIRKKSEHNELIISTLEEVSLHQENIEKIEHVQNWCRDLKILLLQSNLIARIENLNKLKKLEYLNLALNNIEKIENLDGLESLNKLDLTLNFIGAISTVRNLKSNYNLRNLILTGNPCTDFNDYRNYVIAVLPQLEILDGVEIKISDRIKSQSELFKYEKNIMQDELQYERKRSEQKVRIAAQKIAFDEKCYGLDEEERAKLFWETKSENCPETRWALYEQNRKNKRVDSNSKNADSKSTKNLKLFDSNDRPYNINQGKMKFHLQEFADRYDLQLEVYKFLDTSLIEVIVEPHYVRVSIKGKLFQLRLDSEILACSALVERSQITGHLHISMQKQMNITNADSNESTLDEILSN